MKKGNIGAIGLNILFVNIAFPLVVLGIILVVIGAMVHDHAKKEAKQQNQNN